MATFTPPNILAVPPISVADSATAVETFRANPQGYNLMRYYKMRGRGVNVWHMLDGTWMMSDPVPSVVFVGTINYPYPDTLDPINNAIASSWYGAGAGAAQGFGATGFQDFVSPGIMFEYLGGHSYVVSAAEAALITSVGLGAYLS